MVVVVCSVLLQKLWSAKYSVTWNTWGDRQMGICQYLVMGISWSRDPQGFQHKTPAATAMVGAQTTINNQVKAVSASATETAMMTATTMMMGTKAAAAAVVAAAAATAATAAAALRQRGGGSGGGGQRVSSATAVGMAAAAATTNVLPPCAAAVAMKTLVATAMGGAQTRINNQLTTVTATATATATMTATTITMMH